MADESASLVIRTDTDDVARAAATVERLRLSLDAARDAVTRGAPGWELQSRNIANLTAELSRAERAYERMGRAARDAMASGAGRGGMGGGRGGMDPERAGRMSTLGMSVAQTVQDAYYSPAYAVNNLMFMAQMSGGVKQLGKDLAELGTTAVASLGRLPATLGAAAAAFPGTTLAVVTLSTAAYGLDQSLKRAGLGWGDFIDVVAELDPLQAAAATLRETLGEAADSQAVAFGRGALTGPMDAIGELLGYALGWDEATEAVRKHNEELARAAERQKEVAAAVESLGRVQSDAQKRQREEGAALVQRLADMGGEGGIVGAAGRIGGVGPGGKTGKDATDEIMLLASRAQKGDPAAIRDLTGYAKQAGMDPGPIVTETQRREAKQASSAMSGVIGGDLDRVQRLMADDGTTAAAALAELDGAIGRINAVVKAGTLTGEDYARVLDRVNKLREASVQKENDELRRQGAANEAASAGDIAEAERLNARKEARRQGRIASMEEGYGQAFAGGLNQAMLARQGRGETPADVDRELTKQVMGKLANAPLTDEQRLSVAANIVQRQREGLQDFQFQRGMQGDIQRQQIRANLAPEGTFLGTMQRQQLARMEANQASGGLMPEGTFLGTMQRQMLRRQGIDPEAVAQMGRMGAAQGGKAPAAMTPEQKQEKAAETMKAAAETIKGAAEKIANTELVW